MDDRNRKRPYRTVVHPEYGEVTIRASDEREAILCAARKWGLHIFVLYFDKKVHIDGGGVFEPQVFDATPAQIRKARRMEKAVLYREDGGIVMERDNILRYVDMKRRQAGRQAERKVSNE